MAGSEWHDGDALVALRGRNTLIDSQLLKIEILRNGVLLVRIHVGARNDSDFIGFVLEFSGVEEFGFYYKSDSVPWVIENLKLFRTADGLYYLSLDPYGELEVCDDRDQDFILARHISVFAR